MFTPLTHSQDLHTYVSADSLQVGDLFTYTLVLNRDRDYGSIVFPTGENFGEDIEFISRERYQAAPLRDSLIYRFQFFGTDDIIIPRQEVLISRAMGDTVLTSNPIPVFFKTTLGEGDEEFRPFKPIYDFAALIWPYLLGILLFLLVAWYIYKRIFTAEKKPEKTVPATPVPFVNPLNVLESRLIKLGSGNLPSEREEFEKFYIELGDSIREYLERVYEIDALEMTSREILKAMLDYPAHRDMIQITRKVLNEADMVKFARFVPSGKQATDALNLAQDFLATARSNDAARIENMRSVHEINEQERVEKENKILNKEMVGNDVG
ncbi:MAG: hypothetical protein ACFCU6_03435 [Balneolaceae bacterium]